MMSTRTVLGKFLLAQAGFAVDLAVGYITREHDTLDLATLVADIPLFKEFKGNEIAVNGEAKRNIQRELDRVNERLKNLLNLKLWSKKLYLH